MPLLQISSNVLWRNYTAKKVSRWMLSLKVLDFNDMDVSLML